MQGPAGVVRGTKKPQPCSDSSGKIHVLTAWAMSHTHASAKASTQLVAPDTWRGEQKHRHYRNDEQLERRALWAEASTLLTHP